MTSDDILRLRQKQAAKGGKKAMSFSPFLNATDINDDDNDNSMVVESPTLAAGRMAPTKVTERESKDGFLRAKQRQSEASANERIGTIVSGYNTRNSGNHNNK